MRRHSAAIKHGVKSLRFRYSGFPVWGVAFTHGVVGFREGFR